MLTRAIGLSVVGGVNFLAEREVEVELVRKLWLWAGGFTSPRYVPSQGLLPVVDAGFFKPRQSHVDSHSLLPNPTFPYRASGAPVAPWSTYSELPTVTEHSLCLRIPPSHSRIESYDDAFVTSTSLIS